MNYLGGGIEKAVYADTPQNRRLNRVDQEYHRGRKKQGGAAPEPNSNSRNAGSEKKMSKKELMSSYQKHSDDILKNTPYNQHADYMKAHYESYLKHKEKGGYKNVSAYSYNMMTNPHSSIKFKEYAKARQKGMSHEQAAKYAHADMD